MVRLPTVAKVTHRLSIGGRIVVFDLHPSQPAPGTAAALKFLTYPTERH
jgi:hypothetical protein